MALNEQARVSISTLEFGARLPLPGLPQEPVSGGGADVRQMKSIPNLKLRGERQTSGKPTLGFARLRNPVRTNRFYITVSLTDPHRFPSPPSTTTTTKTTMSGCVPPPIMDRLCTRESVLRGGGGGGCNLVSSQRARLPLDWRIKKSLERRLISSKRILNWTILRKYKVEGNLVNFLNSITQLKDKSPNKWIRKKAS